MDTYQEQPHGRFSSNSTLVVTPNIKPELKIIEKKIETKVDNSLDDYKKKIAELEELIKSLSNNKGIGLPDRSKPTVLLPNDIIKVQDSKGYYEIPFDCFIEIKCSGDDMSLWLNPPENDPYKWLTTKWNDLAKAGQRTTANVAKSYKELLVYQIFDNTGYTNTTCTMASKGDKLVITHSHGHNYLKRKSPSLVMGEYNNSRSFVRLLPILK